MTPLGQEMLRWVMVIAIALGVYSFGDRLISPFRNTQSVDASLGVIELPREANGHYYLTAQINGVQIRFVVDTGATGIVLSQSDATRAGLSPDQLAYIHTANTANGTVRIAPVVLETFDVDGLQDQNLRAYVNEGELEGSLLGMSYLRRYEKIIITRDILRLER
ncbi:retropepsin-like aspartic protease family protein [Lentibacter sp.]|jgi:aspartyl protease family protein|uniref:retropepsin-like aspartic protease family protein n=1 Tax=Lentibacter sp. TaxID=2024994 RepID=UPI003F69E1BF